MSHPHSGRHEYGQNFLHDRGVIDVIVRTVACTEGPIVEIGAGDGALTCALQRLGRPLTAIEVDPAAPRGWGRGPHLAHMSSKPIS